MTTADRTKTLQLLHRFAAAYNRHDIDAIMSMMTEDCTFVSYFGPDACGRKFSGQEAVRQRVASALVDFPDASWDDVRHFVDGERAVTEWVFRGTRRGTSDPIERCGCDVFTLRGDKVLVKDTYQKWRETPSPRQELAVPTIHRPLGRYVHAVRYRDLVYVSGCGPFGADGELIGVGDIASQTSATLENARAILSAAGSAPANVLKETLYLTDVTERSETHAARARFYGNTLPASTLIGVDALVLPDMRIEIDMVAWV